MSKGRELFEVLSQRTSEVTLFVPHDAGFAYNQVICNYNNVAKGNSVVNAIRHCDYDIKIILRYRDEQG